MAVTAYIVLAFCALANGGFVRRPLTDGRIVGGEDAYIEDLPYQLSLMEVGIHGCGAAIISDEWVLTAAHCTDGVPLKYLSVRAGSSIMEEGGSVHKVTERIQHEHYSGSPYYDYDFSLLRVSPKFNLGQPGVQAIDLVDENNEPATGDNCVVSGWGRLSSGGSLPSQLQVVRVPIISRDKCNDSYGTITERMICAGFETGGKDACQGDSGGPLAVGGKLAGVVSWGLDCASPRYPGVYSNIANQRSWIKKNCGI